MCGVTQWRATLHPTERFHDEVLCTITIRKNNIHPLRIYKEICKFTKILSHALPSLPTFIVVEELLKFSRTPRCFRGEALQSTVVVDTLISVVNILLLFVFYYVIFVN